METSEKIVIFDGVCNLCNGLVKFIIRHDRNGKIMFTALQSSFARSLTSGQKTDSPLSETVIFFRNGIFHSESDAILEIFSDMGGPWRILYGLKIIPRFIRDFFYRLIARNRYRIFGRLDSCMIPSPEFMHRFLVE